ncbi:MAG: DUF551 domain-containing protein [Oscillospiraceae bacterium]|nr:DUF551 domain-containing protein [Oscillospiraceae bacterium]
MPKIELLPCPFCGRKPKTSELHIQLHQISCLFSKCHARPCVIKKTPEEAAQAWNTRASGWIPCSERLPEVNITVLILFENQIKLSCLDKTKLGFLMNGEFIGKNLVTHWMPLPSTEGLNET